MLECRVRGQWARFILSAPQTKNRLTVALLERFHQLLDDLDADTLKLLTIESASASIFAAGADMHEVLGLIESPDHIPPFAKLGQTLMARLEALPALVIALVSGPCYGGAFDLVAACGQVWAGPGARFCHPGVRIGLITTFGGTVRLPKLLPPAFARYLLLSGDVLSAERAAQLGWVKRVFPDHESMLAAAQALALEMFQEKL